MQEVISALIWWLSMMQLGIVFYSIFPPKGNWWLTLFGLCSCFIPVIYMRANGWFSIPVDIGMAINLIYCFFVLTLVLRLTCTEKTWKILLAVFLIFAMSIVVDFLALWTFHSIMQVPEDAFQGKAPATSAQLFGLLYMTILLSIFLVLWKKFAGKMPVRDITTLLFFFLPIGQIIYFWDDLIKIALGQMSLPFLSMIGIMISIIADLLLMRILLTYSEKINMEKRIRDIEYMQSLQEKQQMLLLAQNQEANALRQQFQKQIFDAQTLLSENKGGKAATLMDDLELTINDSAHHFCENIIVNAVMVNTYMQCETKKIQLETGLDIAADTTISDLHLCSVFTNLLDNAIKATAALPEDQRFISMKAKQLGDYLHVKCTNTTSPIKAKEEKNKRIGYGTRILADIAEKYDGAYLTQSNSDEYSATISLKMAGVGA